VCRRVFTSFSVGQVCEQRCGKLSWSNHWLLHRGHPVWRPPAGQRAFHGPARRPARRRGSPASRRRIRLSCPGCPSSRSYRRPPDSSRQEKKAASRGGGGGGVRAGRLSSAYRGSSHRRKGATCQIIDMVWLYRSPMPVGMKRVFYLFIWRLVPAFVAPRGRGGQLPVGAARRNKPEIIFRIRVRVDLSSAEKRKTFRDFSLTFWSL
jgi:hypothetical protein